MSVTYEYIQRQSKAFTHSLLSLPHRILSLSDLETLFKYITFSHALSYKNIYIYISLSYYSILLSHTHIIVVLLHACFVSVNEFFVFLVWLSLCLQCLSVSVTHTLFKFHFHQYILSICLSITPFHTHVPLTFHFLNILNIPLF